MPGEPNGKEGDRKHVTKAGLSEVRTEKAATKRKEIIY